MVDPFTDLEEARKKRERIIEERTREVGSKSPKQRHGVPFPEHYKKVKEKQTEVIAKIEAGNGIRKTSRESGIARNTVRTIIRDKARQETISEELHGLFQAEWELFLQSYQQGIEARQREWKDPNDKDLYFDAFIEVEAESIEPERMVTLITSWIDTLPKTSDSAFLRGVFYTLICFRNYFQLFDETSKEAEQGKI